MGIIHIHITNDITEKTFQHEIERFPDFKGLSSLTKEELKLTYNAIKRTAMFVHDEINKRSKENKKLLNEIDKLTEI